MNVISERISILKKTNVLSIVILASIDKTKLRLLFLWLVAWTVCGVIVFASYFKTNDRDSKLFILIYLSFWAYFEFNSARAFIWKKSGKEKLWIQDGILNYQREINKKGKIHEFNLSLITPLELVALKPTRFTDSINQSFWVKGGERIEFYAQGKTIRLGMQISDDEAKKIIKEINVFVSN